MRVGLLLIALTVSQGGSAETLKHLSALNDMDRLDVRLNAWYHEHGRFPTNVEGLDAIVPPTVDSLLTDPWGRAYQYRHPAQHSRRAFEIWSVGVDGIDAQGQGDDLSSWARFDPERYPEPGGNATLVMTILILDLPVFVLVAVLCWLIRKPPRHPKT